MKIKELPNNLDLRGIKFKYKEEEYYWYYQWNSGIWCKKNFDDIAVKPIFLDNIREALEFEVTGDYFNRIKKRS